MAKSKRPKPLVAPVEGSLEDHLHGFRILLESIDRKVDATNERMDARFNALEARLELRFQKIEARLDALEIAVRKNSEDIRKNSEDIRKNSEDIVALRHELERTNAMLEQKAQASALAALERRVEALERMRSQ